MNLSQQNQHSNPITEAAKAAFPYSVPMIAGFLFLGIAYGIYMKALGFGFLYPTLMALLIYAGSVEFIAAGALIAPFSPISVLLITLMISARQIFLWHINARKIWHTYRKKTLVFNHNTCR